jgi:hypothetical protein
MYDQEQANLTEADIREQLKTDNYNLDFRIISEKVSLSEEFIDEFSSEVHWVWICSHQKLSEEFILNHEEHIWWKYLSENPYLSEEFIIKYLDKLNIQLLVENKGIILSDNVKLLIKLKNI